MVFRLIVALLLSWSATGCSRTVTLAYAPPELAAEAEGPGLVFVRPFGDRRQNRAKDLGRVRGLFGNVLKRIYTERPVAEEVTHVFQEALATRGLLADGADGPIALEGVVVKLDCNHYSQREAHAQLEVALVDARTGQVLSKGVYESHHSGSGRLYSGVFSSRRSLAALAERTLRQAIDAALDDPDFVAAATGKSRTRLAGPRLPRGSRPQGPGSVPADSREEQLRELDRLYQQGLLSDEEYARRRAHLLGAL